MATTIVLTNTQDRFSWDGTSIHNVYNPLDRWRFDGRVLTNVNNPIKRYTWDGKRLSAYGGNPNSDILWDGRYLYESACPSNKYDLVNGNDVYRCGTVAKSDSKDVHPVAWMVALGLIR